MIDYFSQNSEILGMDETNLRILRVLQEDSSLSVSDRSTWYAPVASGMGAFQACGRHLVPRMVLTIQSRLH